MIPEKNTFIDTKTLITSPNEVKITINGISTIVPAGITILEAAKFLNISIPNLCSMNFTNRFGKCRLCIVELKGCEILLPSCKTHVRNGMIIETHSQKVRKVRKMLLELLLSSHKNECLTCTRHIKCQLQKICEEIGFENLFCNNMPKNSYIGKVKSTNLKNNGSHVIVYNSDKCIKCGRCIHICNEIQQIEAITYLGRSANLSIALHDYSVLNTSLCNSCGQCLLVCPSGALEYKSDLENVWEAIDDKHKTVIVLLSPTSKISIGEEFNKSPGTQLCGQIITALKKLGVNFVFDMSFAADLSSLLYAQELHNRLSNNSSKKLPLITSSCPTVVMLIEQHFCDLIPNLSIYKSPQQLLAKLAKIWVSKNYNVNIKDIYVISIVPCTAKKVEANRLENKTNGINDVNYVMTNKEFAKLMKEAGIELENLPTSSFDLPFSFSSGCGISYGSSGGIIEGTIESLRYIQNMPNTISDEFYKIHTMNEIKYSDFIVGNSKITVACASGLGYCKELLTDLQRGHVKLDFVELLGCPGGCVGGSGQGFDSSFDTRSMRVLALLREDRAKSIRRPSDNAMVHLIIKELLENINSNKAQSILEAKYYKRYNL